MPPHSRTSPLVFFDLDGPLLDVRARYHGVYCGIARELGVTPLDAAEYWRAKQARRPLAEFFPAPSAGVHLSAFYRERWLARIEAPEWLALDSLVLGAGACLDELRSRFKLYLVTLRRDRAALDAQLDALSLRPLFEEVLSGWSESDGASVKAALIRRVLNAGGEHAPAAALVGDTEVDVGAARLLGLRAIGVSYGIRAGEELLALGAECVVDGPSELLAALTADR